MTDLLRSLTTIVNDRINLSWTHVRGHTGHAWNEAADTVAKHAAKHGCFGIPQQTLPLYMFMPYAAQWVWTASVSPQTLFAMGYPWLCEKGFIIDHMPLMQPPDTCPPLPFDVQPQLLDSDYTLAIKLATCNVQSASDRNKTKHETPNMFM